MSFGESNRAQESVPLRSPVPGEEQRAGPAITEAKLANGLEIVGYHRAILKFEVECRCDQLRWNLKQLLRQRDEFLDKQTAMTVVHRLGKRNGDACTHANQCRLFDTEFGRNLTSHAEADAAVSRANR